ncbi:copper resistance CopC family protein [Methylosinus sp. Sm6]|uniref:copper resistance CopC family protein n=1 Tax=Methylosinus sp. Sm6 TaxID=2866948 RepID=UPI001C99883A|nr:copper resistance CopC family protein [Methylosinus sp. Sm6]MBY6241439.1 copper resistance protein CopC [Methylosinus sp. Sm6]
MRSCRDIALAVGAIAFWTLFAARPSQAHAILADSTPREAQLVTSPDVPIELRFNCRIDAKRSRVLVIGPDLRSAVLPLAETAAPDAVRAHLGDLRQGVYQLHWQVLSVDGHITRGDISFRVLR